jgi:bacterioferritin-associated ferredoxin
MIVCQCAAISDREVRAHAARGAATIDDLAADCPAGQHCGGCRPEVEHILALHCSRTLANR